MNEVAERRVGPRLGEVDLWWTPLDGFDDECRAFCRRLLSASELARYEAFKAVSARDQYLAAHGLLRSALSRYRNIAPERWAFSENPYGRPFIDQSLGVTDLHFSLSHTEGLVACAVGAFPELGVDVELRDRNLSVAELAPTVLAPQEIARLRAEPDSQANEFFFRLWTLKEAYVKARGMGLSLPMQGVWFDLDADSPAGHFTKAIADDAARWTFRVVRPTARHILSVAAAPPDGELAVVLRETRAIDLSRSR
ncbi:MAG: 4'-phosphopantetheinyl transferase superfamily protein [Hyphomicrobiales bacterium]|nr:4'-phosphopantetheinyl transferase superfamily protein [Hyphomicrobiales bacterium]MBV8663711.1 4'-phosphopantetheinyl transferase superfamily protein [Hyphomicrobiales bacterium]